MKGFNTLHFDPNDEGGGGAVATLENVAKSVHDLSEAVEGMKQGKVDESAVRAIAEEVVQAQKAATSRRSFTPDDIDDDGASVLLGGDTQARLREMHGRSPAAVAKLTRRPVEDVSEFQQRGDRLMIAAAYLGRDPRELDYYKDEYAPMLQAMDSGTTAEGKEFVPTELSGTLIERVALELMVIPLFTAVQMPTNPFDIPGRPISRQRLGNLAEATADTGQTKATKRTVATRKVTLTAKKFAGEVLVSKELEEDSLIAIMPFVEEEIVDYLSADLEDTSVNGDTAGTHQDADVTAADDPRKNWDGLRKSALSAAKTDASNAALTVAMLRTNRKKMGKYGVRPGQLAHLLSINAYIDILSDASLITLEKYGPAATILTGELGKVDNIPVIVSEYVRTDLNASGVQDGVTTNRTEAITVLRTGFAVGNRRDTAIQVLRELYSESDQDAILVTTRKAFAARYPVATEPIVAVTYNVKT